MDIKNKVEVNQKSVITEGKARIAKKDGVFYNKVQEFNRDLSVLAVHTFLKNELWKKSKMDFVKENVSILDALSATGLRSIRYSLECQHCVLPLKITANDISSKAIETIRDNIENNQAENISVNQDDASMFMHKCRASNQKLTIIDLDPYGSPAPFLDSAIQSIVDGGLLMVTCTDMAVLCGNHGETCHAKYGAFPVKAKFCHEMALRILLQSLESHANRYGRYVVPLLSLSIDFYVRIFVQVFTSPFETRKSTSKLSYIFICNGCESFRLQPLTCEKSRDEKNLHFVPAKILLDRRCDLCGHHLQIGGPIWSDSIHDMSFVELLKTELKNETLSFGTFRRMQGILQMVSEEIVHCPLYYQLDRLCSLANCRMPPIKVFRSAIIHGGYQVSYSHALKNSIKTNAPNDFIWCVVKELAKSTNAKFKETDPFFQIFNKILDYQISFDVVEAAEPLSKSSNLLRYQVNPEENWGPKSRPSANDADKRKRNQGKHSCKQIKIEHEMLRGSTNENDREN